MKRKVALITGITGQDGSYLAEILLKYSVDIAIISNTTDRNRDSLKNINIKVSKLAQGLPVGGEIESLDDGTLISAFKNRKGLNSGSD